MAAALIVYLETQALIVVSDLWQGCTGFSHMMKIAFCQSSV